MRLVRRALVGGGVLAVISVGLEATTSSATPGTPRVARGGFGGAVLVGAGEVFVGEADNQFRPNAVYVYRKTGAAWRQVATLRAPNAAVLDPFGTALALDGTRLFVGAGPQMVQVFTKQGTTWSHAATIAASSITGDSARFGSAIAASGEWLLIGKAVAGGGRGRGGGGRGRGAGPGGPELPAGAVYAFRRSDNGQYVHHSTLASADSANAGDAFGSSIAIAGGRAIIGARSRAGGLGVVHEFTVDSTGTWQSQGSFAPIGLQAGDAFGSAVALVGDRAIVTAPGDAGGHGAAYAFRKVPEGAGRGGRGGGGGGGGGFGGRGGGRGNSGWQEVARLASPSGARFDGFGSAIAADGREVWVGAPGADGQGGVFIFPHDTAGFRPAIVRFLAPATIEDGADVGQSISIRGNVAAVGATGFKDGAGGVVIYERDAAGTWRAQPVITVPLDEIAPLTGSERRCTQGGKVEMFDCGSAELQAFLPPSRLTHDGHYIEMNDVWGWTDPRTGKEWAIVGRRDGTTFVDLSNPTNPVPVADLPLTPGARPASWRDMKVYKNHAYIVSDGAGQHGMQVFDLARLRTLRPVGGQPVEVRPDTLYTEIASAHNIVINEESGYAYSVGSSAGGTTCGGGLHMIDIREPRRPKFAGCFADTTTGSRGTGYSHDAQCVTYKGPDTRYTAREICIGSNENAISIADVTDKQTPKALSRAAYPNVSYAHQGWFTDDHKYFYLDDEGDETSGRVEKTRTLIWDLSDLENPRLAREHLGVESTSDHNLYVKGNLMYQANYRSGLRILDISDPENPREIAFFDTAPYTTNTPGYNGAWSVYPYFRSGSIVVNSIEQGLFIVKHRPIVF